MDRVHDQINFHATQLLSGHGCFYKYLYRIGKADFAICPFCESEEDSAEHTIERCGNWKDERDLLMSTIGNDLSLGSIVSKILDSEENWEAFLSFADDVMIAKEDDERARSQQLDDDE